MTLPPRSSEQMLSMHLVITHMRNIPHLLEENKKIVVFIHRWRLKNGAIFRESIT